MYPAKLFLHTRCYVINKLGYDVNTAFRVTKFNKTARDTNQQQLIKMYAISGLQFSYILVVTQLSG